MTRDHLDLDHLPRRLRRRDACEYLRRVHGIFLEPGTLANYAARSDLRGNGPPYRKVGRIPYYGIADLNAWARTRLGRRVTSNAELREAS